MGEEYQRALFQNATNGARRGSRLLEFYVHITFKDLSIRTGTDSATAPGLVRKIGSSVPGESNQ